MNTRLCIDGEGAVVTLPEDIGVTVKEGDEELGVIYPVVGGIRIVSSRIENRLGLTYLEVQEPPALRVNLHRPQLPPTGSWELNVARPRLMDETVEKAVQHVYSTIFGDNVFTHTEQMFAWGMVLEKLLTSLTMDLQSEMLKERVMPGKKG
jgi:hypothetical protein